MSLETKLVKFIPLIDTLSSNGASLKMITEEIASRDNNISKANNLYKQVSALYLKYKKNTLYSKYSKIIVLKLPDDLHNDNYVKNYFYKYSNWHLALQNTLSHYALYIVDKNEFISSSSIIILDKLYCKRFMRWFNIEDNIIVDQAKSNLENYDEIVKNCKTELENIDEYYLMFYNTVHNILLKNLSNNIGKKYEYPNK